jgi:hypothetical protein
LQRGQAGPRPLPRREGAIRPKRLAFGGSSRFNLGHIDIVVIVTCFHPEKHHMSIVDRRLACCVSVLKYTTALPIHLA